jgi:hypothetical protein
MTEYNVASTERGEGVEQYRRQFKGIRDLFSYIVLFCFIIVLNMVRNNFYK